MPTEDRLTANHPVPLLLSGHADEQERGSLLLLNASILLLVASLVGMAIILSFGNPAMVFADIKASPTDISDHQLDTVQSTQTNQSTTYTLALPPTASVAPTRDGTPAASVSADQSQAEISAALPGGLLKQFQAWAAKEDARAAQIETVRPAQDARAEVLQSAQAPRRSHSKALKSTGLPKYTSRDHRI